MGLFRKMTSISTLGAVDFRSAKDRTAAHTATIAKHSKKQTNLMQRQMRTNNAGYLHYFQPQVVTAAPGWYACPGDPIGSVRLWDGQNWTPGFRP